LAASTTSPYWLPAAPKRWNLLLIYSRSIEGLGNKARLFERQFDKPIASGAIKSAGMARLEKGTGAMRASTKLSASRYTNAEIAAKIDFTPDYIAAICYLLEHGEERLLAAVERGVMPANIAVEIARAPDHDVQQALAEAYESCPGTKSRPFGGSLCSAISAARSRTKVAARRTPVKSRRRR
jgi:hypothetical protein